MADDRLERWAAERLPELLARAEDEAVAEVRALLRDALVEAALDRDSPDKAAPERDAPVEAAFEPDRPRARDRTPGREAPRRERRPREPVAPKAEQAPGRVGEAQWLYAVARGGAATASVAISGVSNAPVQALEESGLVALVSTVPLPEFGEEMLKERLNDLGWLEEVARAHQRVVDDAFERGPVVPLRLCTIYDSADRIRDLLREDGDRFEELLASIEGREEWSVKLFVDPERLEAEAAPQSDETSADADAGPGLGSGGAYLARRKSARSAREAADRLAGELVEEVHARLQDWATDAVVGRPQNPELSHHSGQMLLNGAYLVDSDRSERFSQLVDELQERYADLGARLELSGPWPPYNFIAADP